MNETNKNNREKSMNNYKLGLVFILDSENLIQAHAGKIQKIVEDTNCAVIDTVALALEGEIYKSIDRIFHEHLDGIIIAAHKMETLKMFFEKAVENKCIDSNISVGNIGDKFFLGVNLENNYYLSLDSKLKNIKNLVKANNFLEVLH